MKILHVETGPSLFGGGLQVGYLLKRLPDHGIESILLSDSRSDLGSMVKAANPTMTCYETSMGGELDIRLLFRIFWLCFKHRIRAIHVHSRRGADVWGPLAGALLRIPVIITRRVDNVEGFVLAGVRYGMVERVVSISRGIEFVLKSECVPGDKRETIHSGVDLDVYRTLLANAAPVPGLPEKGNHIWIGMVAQFILRKGHHRLVEIAKRMVESGLPVNFLLFGKGPLETGIKARIAELGLEGAIHFCGFRKDLETIFPHLDILYHPADKEGLGVSLLQANACGVPVVGGNAGGIPEIIVDGVTGYLVEPDDLDAHYHCLLDLIQDEERRRAFGKQARQQVERWFSADVMAAKNAALYAKVADF